MRLQAASCMKSNQFFQSGIGLNAYLIPGFRNLCNSKLVGQDDNNIP